MKKLIVKSSLEAFLQDIFIDGTKFNGYTGKVEVPEYAELEKSVIEENNCTVLKFVLSLKKPYTYKSAYCRVKIPYSYPPNSLKVWAARSNYPQDIYYMGSTRLVYGDVCYGTMIPAITLYDTKRDLGLTIVKDFKRTGGVLSFNFDSYHGSGVTVEFDHLALTADKPVELKLVMAAHEGCWRPGLQFIVDRYKEFFYPANENVWQHHKAFAITNPFTLPEAVDTLPIAWSEIHNHFPYYSNYAPEEPAWDSVVLHDYPDLAEEVPEKITPERINKHIDYLHKRNIKAMLYIQVSGDCLIAPAERDFPEDIARDEENNMMLTWKDCCFVNASRGSKFGEYINKMIDRFLAMYPAIDGVFLDQLCYQALDHAHSDSRTAFNDKPAAEYGVSYEYNLEKLANALHKSNKFVWANGPFDIEIARWCDGVMSEGTSGISETHKYLCIRKPLLIHTYPTDVFKAESMFRYCLLTGASYSYGGSSTLRQPAEQPEAVQKLFEEYKFLADTLLDCEILLMPSPFKLPPNCRGEIFQSKCDNSRFLSILPNSNAPSLDVVINLEHGSNAVFCSNKNHQWQPLEFKENSLTLPNNAQAYLIKF
ncbi:MAG: hypothetical protein J6Q81_03385 [Lentisphaeria bacterium]|nr:hypothetical protein [Lentisphaeria bacterium]